jgi:hypothetical protein
MLQYRCLQLYIKLKEVFLRAVSTAADYKTDIKVLFASFIFCTPLHVSICRDHHQVVLEYISVVIELSVKIDPFFTSGPLDDLYRSKYVGRYRK